MKRRMRGALVVAGLLLLAGCAAPGAPGASAEPSVVPPIAPAPTPAPSVTLVTDEITLPRDCAAVFDDDFVTEMTDGDMPLNDPGLSLAATTLQSGQDLLASVEHLRCTWGLPSEVGMATAIMLVSTEEASALIAEAEAAEFVCGTISATERRCDRHISGENPMGSYTQAEEHVWRGNAWITTHALNFWVPDYTDDLVAALWG